MLQIAYSVHRITVAVPAIVALGSVIGCRVGMKPQRNTDCQSARQGFWLRPVVLPVPVLAFPPYALTPDASKFGAGYLVK
jgi:hypothetical protein